MGIPFNGHDNRQVLNQPVSQTPPVSQTNPIASPPTDPASKTMELLDRIGPAYRLDGSLPEAVRGGAATNVTQLLREEVNHIETTSMGRAEELECATCASRTYQDRSNDPGVSFKSPGNISPEASFAMVSAHEQEHVTNEQLRADQDGRKILSQTVQIFMDTCPECGKAFASGGVTKTATGSDEPSREENLIEQLMPGATADTNNDNNTGTNNAANNNEK